MADEIVIKVEGEETPPLPLVPVVIDSPASAVAPEITVLLAEVTATVAALAVRVENLSETIIAVDMRLGALAGEVAAIVADPEPETEPEIDEPEGALVVEEIPPEIIVAVDAQPEARKRRFVD